MIHLIQVGAGSGGMPVLDMLSRDPRITKVTLIEPDIYKPHNVERHLFPLSGIEQSKAILAEQWLRARRPDLEIDLLECDLMSESEQERIHHAIASCDLGVCAVDNEPAKYHWDRLMRQHHKPWTLGEVLSGGIGGFVHWFMPEGPCYGCVAGHLKRSVTVEKPTTPDYSQPQSTIEEATVPADIASIHVIASMHALITRHMLDAMLDKTKLEESLGFTTMLWTLRTVPDVFPEAFRPYRFRISRSPDCLMCREVESVPTEQLDQALDQALSRLADD